MSVKVDLGELGQHLQRHPFAYLLTVGEDLRMQPIGGRCNPPHDRRADD